MNDAPMFCRIPSDNRPCRAGLMADEHRLLNGRYVHPELDDTTGRWIWPEGAI